MIDMFTKEKIETILSFVMDVNLPLIDLSSITALTGLLNVTPGCTVLHVNVGGWRKSTFPWKNIHLKRKVGLTNGVITKWPFRGNIRVLMQCSNSWAETLYSSLLSVLEAFRSDNSRVRLLCTSNVEVKLIHVLNGETGPGHTSQSKATHWPHSGQWSYGAQTDNTAPSRLTSPLAALVLPLFMAFLLFLPSAVDNLLMPQ